MITYKDTSKLIISHTSSNDIMNLKSKKPQASASSGFRSVFDSVLNNTTSVSKTDNRPSFDQDSKIKYKSLRDIASNEALSTNKSAVKQTYKDAKAQNIDSEPVEIQDGEKEHDEQLNVLAQMLGVSPHELVKLAKELGFSLDDLQDSKKLGQFIDKLVSVLELNDLQKDMIKLLEVEVSRQLKSISNNQEVSNTGNTHASKVDARIESEVKAIDPKLAEQVKSKLDLLIKNAKVESNAVETEISRVIAAMRAQAHAKIANSQNDAKKLLDDAMATDILASGQSIVEDTSKTKEVKVEKNTRLDTNNSASDHSEERMVVKSGNLTAQSETLDMQMEQQNFVNGNGQVNFVNSPETVEKTVFTMQQPIKSTEVISQVVEHAKVIVGQDKAEMVIHLKPDHLGKLELKVVTEQGIVAAKFIAESQQVKEVIETNMQLLKEALQKQGIAIDGVSVQVGHDSKNEFQQSSSYQSNNNSSASRNQYGRNEIGSSKIGVNAFDTLPDRLQQYAGESNTINLTA